MVKTEPFSEKASPKIKTHWVHIEPDNQLIEDTDFLRKQMKEFPGRYKHLIEVLKKEEVMKEIEKFEKKLRFNIKTPVRGHKWATSFTEKEWNNLKKRLE